MSLSDLERQLNILRERIDELEKYQNRRLYVPARSAAETDPEMWDLSLAGADVVVAAGEVHHGVRAVVDVAEYSGTITQDHSYAFVEFDLAAQTASWNVSTTRPISSTDASNSIFRVWMWKLRLISGVVSVEQRGHRGPIEIPGTFA